MKRVLSLFCFLGLLILLSACEGTMDNVDIQIGDLAVFNESEIQSAVEAVLVAFRDFNNCDLLRLWFDEVESNRNVDVYLEYGRGSVNGVERNNVIVLLSDFYAGSNSCPSLNRNSVIENWQWVLIRENYDSEWVVDDSGW